MNISLNFGGFYESFHDDICERATAWAVGADDPDTGEIDSEALYSKNIDWASVYTEYAQQWLDLFNDETGARLEFVRIVSPRFYNFETDAIIAECSRRDLLRLLDHARWLGIRDNVRERMRDLTQSRSGFIAFYSYEDLFKSENRDIFAQCVCDAIIQHESDAGGYGFLVEDFSLSFDPEIKVAA
jgi:hypothetical protein